MAVTKTIIAIIIIIIIIIYGKKRTRNVPIHHAFALILHDESLKVLVQTR